MLRPRRREVGGDLLLASTDDLVGYEVEETIGLVTGRSGTRLKALELMSRAAQEDGANAVVAVRVDSMVSRGLVVRSVECFAYGTAVRLRRLE